MIETGHELSLILENIIEELSITETMQNKAISGYTAVGNWLTDDLKKDIYIYPQGSMALGTIIRPISDKDEYDIDLVCLIKDGSGLEAKEIKQLIGNSLKNNGRYNHMLQKEGKRCWTLSYDEFHMDILPAVPGDTRNSNIRITHTEDGKVYLNKYSNPVKYRKWFLQQMLKGQVSEMFSIEARSEIEKVPIYNQIGNLQKIVKLLKRHRDIIFEGADHKPISIIITTLAAKAYKGNLSLYDELKNILMYMESFIEKIDGTYIIRNPVEYNENFAEKWNSNSSHATQFFSWIQYAKSDFLNIKAGLDEVAELWGKSLGESLVNRAVKKYALGYRNARQDGKLHVNANTGLCIGTTTITSSKVKAHTFFGAEE